MVRQLASAPAGLHRSVVRYVRMQPEEVSRQMPYQPRPAIFVAAARCRTSRGRPYSSSILTFMVADWSHAWAGWSP